MDRTDHRTVDHGTRDNRTTDNRTTGSGTTDGGTANDHAPNDGSADQEQNSQQNPERRSAAHKVFYLIKVHHGLRTKSRRKQVGNGSDRTCSRRREEAEGK